MRGVDILLEGGEWVVGSDLVSLDFHRRQSARGKRVRAAETLPALATTLPKEHPTLDTVCIQFGAEKPSISGVVNFVHEIIVGREET